MPLLEEEARKRRKQTEGRPSTESKLVVKVPPVKKQENKSAYQAGKLLGVGEKYVRMAKKLKETSPMLLEEVRKGQDMT